MPEGVHCINRTSGYQSSKNKLECLLEEFQFKGDSSIQKVLHLSQILIRRNSVALTSLFVSKIILTNLSIKLDLLSMAICQVNIIEGHS